LEELVEKDIAGWSILKQLDKLKNKIRTT